MDLSEAIVELNRPLKFGDVRQVEARNYLELLFEIHERARRCHYCAGEGVTRSKSRNGTVLCRCIRREPREISIDMARYFKMDVLLCAMGVRPNGIDT